MEKNISSLNNSNSHNNTNFMKFLIPSLLGLLLFIIPLPTENSKIKSIVVPRHLAIPAKLR